MFGHQSGLLVVPAASEHSWTKPRLSWTNHCQSSLWWKAHGGSNITATFNVHLQGGGKWRSNDGSWLVGSEPVWQGEIGVWLAGCESTWNPWTLWATYKWICLWVKSHIWILDSSLQTLFSISHWSFLHNLLSALTKASPSSLLPFYWSGRAVACRVPLWEQWEHTCTNYCCWGSVCVCVCGPLLIRHSSSNFLCVHCGLLCQWVLGPGSPFFRLGQPNIQIWLKLQWVEYCIYLALSKNQKLDISALNYKVFWSCNVFVYGPDMESFENRNDRVGLSKQRGVRVLRYNRYGANC